MSGIVPPMRPRQTWALSKSILAENGVSTDQVAILGMRGYYRDTMGVPGKNDRGIYDDAIFIWSPASQFAFNANVDPSVYRKATSARKGIASLVKGVYRYVFGTHGLSKPVEKQYRALVQGGKVTVSRDGGQVETGYFGINIHRGGYTTTSSEGCQTIYPAQWDEFMATLKQQLNMYRQDSANYLLVEAE